jgi:hypothetical protein
MYEQIFDSWRKATETTLQVQQDLVKTWFQPFGVVAGKPIGGVKDPGPAASFGPYIEQTIQLQQDLLKTWLQPWGAVTAAVTKEVGSVGGSLPTGVAVPGLNPAVLEQARTFQKQWTAAVTETLKKQTQALDSHFKAGVKTIEEAFKVSEAKSPQEARKVIEELWKSSFDYVKEALEIQVKEFTVLSNKWLELMTPPAAGKV